MSMKVAIFPGHVGKDPGAIDPIDTASGDNWYSVESTTVGPISSKVAMFLRLLDIDYRLQPGSFDYRIANTRDCDFGISIHVDSFPQKPEKRGFHVIYYTGSKRGLDLALSIESAVEACPGAVRARGVHSRGDLAILKMTAFPCVLIELGFLSNITDEAMLQEDHYQYQLAFSIVQGIRVFMYA